MTASGHPRWSWIRRELRPFWVLAAGLVVYGILRLVFAGVVGGGGLVTPSGSVDGGLALLGLVMLVMRFAVLAIVPLVVTYRVVWRLFALGRARRRGAGADETIVPR
jgi:hypothetical protein